MKTQKLLALFILLTAGSATSGWAAIDTWNGTTFNWSTGSNWDSGVEPQAGDSLEFSGTTADVTSKNDISALSFTTITFDSGAAAYSISESTSSDKITVTSGITDNSANVETINGAFIVGGNVTLNVSNSTGNLTFAQQVSGTKSLTLSGPGTVTMASGSVAMTYSGGTIVNAGTLMANTTATAGATGTGSVTIGNTAVLGGSGVIDPTASGAQIKINSGGILAPGTAGNVNTLTINAGVQTASFLTFSSSASLNFNLGAGNTSSLLSLTGTFAGEVAGLSGNTFNFTDLTSGQLSTGLYTLISTDTTASVFSGLSTGNLSGFTVNGLSGDTAQLQLNLVNGDETLQLDITSVAAVPEPGTWALLMGGVAILLIAQRRRFKPV